MSRALNLVSNNIQGYGLSESSCLPCLGLAGRSECKTLQVKIISSKCSLRQISFVCTASSGGQRRNPDFSRQNRHGFSRSRNRHIDERDSSENRDDSELLSTKNGSLFSHSNSPKSQPTASPGPREREIVELFKKVQAKLREKAAVKLEQKKIESLKGQQNKESETVDSLLNLLRKHSVEQGKKKVNGENANNFNFDHPRQGGKSNGDKSSSFFKSESIVGEEPQETNRPSFSRPPSSFKRRSPVTRARYEPIVSAENTTNSESHLNVDEKTSSESDPEPKPGFYSEPDMDMVSGLVIEQQEEEPETELDPETDFLDSHAKEDDIDEKDTVKRLMGFKDLSSMKLAELRALAKARGMKGFSKLKKSELVGLLSEDSI